MEALEKDLENLVNKYSIDADLSMNDFVISRYLVNCLNNLLSLRKELLILNPNVEKIIDILEDNTIWEPNCFSFDLRELLIKHEIKIDNLNSNGLCVYLTNCLELLNITFETEKHKILLTEDREPYNNWIDDLPF